jgi:protein-ribulosamine 3-kinase
VDALARALLVELNGRLGSKLNSAHKISGGDIHEAYCVTSESGERLFVKAGYHVSPGLFEREAEGLDFLAETNAVSIPKRVAWGQGAIDSGAPFGYLALEYLEPTPKGRDYAERLGQNLAQLHRVQDGPPGLESDNFIAVLPQSNAPRATWADFYAEARLLPLVKRAVAKGLAPRAWFGRFDALARDLPNRVPSEAPSRLHGDLWSGNVVSGPGGLPFLVDPAVYRGHREVDLAMMRLFGGFSEATFRAYEAVFPCAAGAEERIPLYQLYPLLVHVNLFGGSYVSQVETALFSLAS